MKKRTYSLFVKEGTKWTRISSAALPLDAARRMFQGMLLHGSTTGKNVRLRPAEDDWAHADEHRANRYRVFPELKKEN
jgi:hypothetical protein